MKKIITVKVTEIIERLSDMSIKLEAVSPEDLPPKAASKKELTLSYHACFAVGDVLRAVASQDYWLVQPLDHTWEQTEAGGICVHCGKRDGGGLFIEPCLRCGKEVGANELYCADCETKEAIRC